MLNFKIIIIDWMTIVFLSKYFAFFIIYDKNEEKYILAYFYLYLLLNLIKKKYYGFIFYHY